MHNAFTYGRLKFGDKSKASMQVKSKLTLIKDANFVDPLEILMVKAIEGVK